MMYEISRDSTLFHNYLEVSKNRMYKILCLFEEENEGLFHYVNSLIFELYGVQHCITGVKDSFHYLSILTTLESILSETITNEKDLIFIKSEVFRLMGHIEKLQRGE